MFKRAVQVVSAVVVVGVIGLVSIWTGQAVLVASLGSAAFIQLFTPDTPSAKIRPMAVGQFAGVGGGFAGVYIAAAASAPPFLHDHPLTWIRLAASVIAIAVTAMLQIGLKAVSAAGATLALLLSLGSEPPTWTGAARLVIGVALVVALGELARRAVLASEPKS